MTSTPLSTEASALRKTITALKKARTFVSRGWTKETMHARIGGKNQYCMLGGLLRATGSGVNLDRDYDGPTYILGSKFLAFGAQRKLRRKVTPHYWTADFNDAPRRTQKQVLEAYDIAIAKAERDLASAS